LWNHVSMGTMFACSHTARQVCVAPFISLAYEQLSGCAGSGKTHTMTGNSFQPGLFVRDYLVWINTCQ
jgi:hypothetical protein